MSLIALILVVTGLGLGVWGSVILVRHLFITDEEIEELSRLPVEEANTHISTKPDNKGKQIQMAIALTDPQAIKSYRDRFIENRRSERSNCIRGLWFLVGGFVLQGLGALLSYLSTLPSL